MKMCRDPEDAKDVLLKLKQQGYRPDAILAHPGWGETLYARDVFPDARLIHFCEWYYGTPGSDVGFDNNNEDVDAADIRADGSLLLSTLGDFNVPGARGADEDVIRFVPTQLGNNTSGSSSLYLDLSALGISTAADIGSLEYRE